MYRPADAFGLEVGFGAIQNKSLLSLYYNLLLKFVLYFYHLYFYAIIPFCVSASYDVFLKQALR